jgi:hypothetical protein
MRQKPARGHMTKMVVKVTSKNVTKEYVVQNPFQAIKRFFRDISAGVIPLDQVGVIGFWERIDGEKIPFRIPPALYRLGAITFDEYRQTLKQIAEFTDEELEELAEADAWMVER